MTVTYTAEVATSSFACFLKLLIRWRGSIYKLMWKEFLIFLGAFYTLNFVYRFALNTYQKRTFEMVTRYCEQYNNLIPVAFVLGFYVSVVLNRWWNQFNIIPWPDRMALFVTANMHGNDERGRLMRRTMMRYLCLSYLLTMTSISPVVKKRFPSLQHMVDAGFMNPNEEKVISSIDTPHNKYFVPLVWATSLVSRARKENKIKDDFAVKTLIDEINSYRGMLGTLFCYDWISIPLVYTQVVTLAVYTFFFSCLMGRQLVENRDTADVYVPVFTFLQFFFYMGWLKVAESLVNPFGEDDDDFDINNCIDRNLQVSYLIVDEMHQEHPELIKDQYWDEINFDLPYTEAALPFREEPHLGSAMHINITPRDAEFVQFGSTLASIIEEDPAGVTIPGNKYRNGRNNIPYARSNSKPERNKFLDKLLRRSSSNMSKRDDRKSQTQRQVSDTSTVGPETPSQTRHSQFPGSGRIVQSEEDIFEMSDLDSVMTGKPSHLDLTSQFSVVSDSDVIDGKKGNKSDTRKGLPVASASQPHTKEPQETRKTESEDEPLLEGSTPDTLKGSPNNKLKHVKNEIKT